MRVVITGAAGFIGSRFAELLLADADRLGYDDVVLLDALTYSGRRENMEQALSLGARFVHGSINDPDVVDEVLALPLLGPAVSRAARGKALDEKRQG